MSFLKELLPTAAHDDTFDQTCYYRPSITIELASLSDELPPGFEVPVDPLFTRLWREAASSGTEAAWEALPRRFERALHDEGSAEDVRLLSDRANDRDLSLRQTEAVIRCLGVAGESFLNERPSVVEAIARFVKHSSTEIRIAAVEALWQVGTEDACVLLRQAVDDKDDWVRQTARTALAELT